MFVILTAAMTFNFAACKDDDTKDNGDDPTEQEGDDSVPDTFWDVLAQIVQSDQITSDYEGKTFEPAIGEEDPSDPQTRIVYTNDMAAAAKSFAYLTGVSVDENTATAEWKDEKVGTMTYTKVNDGKDYATVDVRIAAMPHLSKIIYRDGEQSGANGKFSGSAYYRFGDVVSRERDGVKEYWICVRPAFGPEKKETTHWVSVSPLPNENIYTYPGSNGFDYTLPKDLKYDKEHFQNLAEMLFAMCYPTEWQENITNYSPTMFHDFSSKNVKYHNSAFWKNVAASWQNKGLDQAIFGKYIQDFVSDLKTDGLYLLYYKYSWTTSISNYCSLYQLHYTNTPNGKYCNMQTSSPASTIKKQMIDKKNPANDIKLSVKEQQKAHPYITCSEFFGDDKPRWIIRYATGEELSDVKKYTNIYEPISGVKEEYRYYRDVNPVTTLSVHEPEITSGDVPSIATYYHAGDIITRNSDGTPWMCVRPAGGINDDKNSYWICLSPFDKSGKCIIEEDRQSYIIDGENVIYVYAKNLMSKQTAYAASHTFCCLTDATIKGKNNVIPNVSEVLTKIKAMGYDITQIHARRVEYAKEGQASYSFAYGNPIADPAGTKNKRYVDLQPFTTSAIETTKTTPGFFEVIYSINPMLYKDGGRSVITSLVDGYSKDFFYKELAGDPWPDTYDFHNMLHKYDSNTKKLAYIYDEEVANGERGIAYTSSNPLRTIISPELKLQDDNKGARPSSASKFTDVFVSAKDLNGKYFDYWQSLRNIALTVDGQETNPMEQL